MNFPEFTKDFPLLDIPFPPDVVAAYAVRSDKGLVVFFDFHQDLDLPAHSHKGQWGTCFAGEVELTIEGVTQTYRPGETWNIPAGAIHSARIKAGTKAMDVFEEPDRYPLQSPNDRSD